ncbi:MAG: porin [Pseudomonadota bacterium]
MTSRKLLPATIGAILVGGMAAAQADVTVFGHLDQSIVDQDNDFNGVDDTNFVCTTCSVGFKGSEDLGNGLKAIFKLDFQFDMNNRNNGRASANGISNATVLTATAGGALGSVLGATVVTDVSSQGAITDRDQWLGLAGNFGQVRIGTISTLYKSHGAMIDPLYRTSVQGRDVGLQSRFHSGAGEEGQGRATNTARYDSPSWNGLKAGAHYTLDSDEGDGEDDNPYGLGVSYENGGILVFADYITNNQGGDAETEAYKIGGKYSLNNFAVMGQYEAAETGNNVEPTLWHLGASYTMGNNTLYGAYGQGDPDTSSADDSTAWTIAGIHQMSKRTAVYVGYNSEDRDGPEADRFTAGVKHKF